MRKGIRVITHATFKKLEKSENGVIATCSNGEVCEFGQVMLAVGRDPYINGLGLESVGVETKNGAIVVNEYSQTNVENIYAVGDVTNLSLIHI